MTHDDRTAWRYYAGAALTGLLSNSHPQVVKAFAKYTELKEAAFAESAATFASEMLAAEKERFPAPKLMSIESLNKELEELKSQQPDPLAGTGEP